MKVGGALMGLLPAVASVLVYSDCRSTKTHFWDCAQQLMKVFQGGRRLPLRPFPHTADGLEERLLVWALRQSKQNISKHFIFNRVSGRYRLKWTHAVASCYYSWSLFIDLGLVNVTIVELILCMVVVPRWFCWPMWLPTEALPPSTLTSMHWRWHQQSTHHHSFKIYLSFDVAGGTPRWDGNPWSSLRPILQCEHLVPCSVLNLILTFVI